MASPITSTPVAPAFDEKSKTFNETVHEDVESEAGLEKPVWRPGFFAQFPALGAGALLVALICAISAIVVLKVSDNSSQTRHPWNWLAPNVILGGLNSAANLALTVAIGNGIAISWWRRTLKGASIEELHRSWSFSTSVLSLVLSAKYFNVIALTALVTKISIADNMLLQRATQTAPGFDPAKPITNAATWNVSTTFPATGYRLLGSDESAASLTQAMAYAIQAWQRDGGLYWEPFPEGCRGLCYLDMPAIGFGMDCSNTKAQNIELLAEMRNTTTAQVPLFDISFEMSSRPFPGNNSQSETILLNLLWTSTSENGTVPSTDREDKSQNVSLACHGQRFTRQCVLYPALVNYATKVTSLGTNKDIKSNDDNSPTVQQWLRWDDADASGDDQLVGIYNASRQQMYDSPVIHPIFMAPTNNTAPTRLGGLKKAFDMHLAAHAGISLGNYSTGFNLSQDGTSSSWLTNHPGYYQCDYQYGAPIFDYADYEHPNTVQAWSQPDILDSINQLVFPVALGLGFDQDLDEESLLDPSYRTEPINTFFSGTQEYEAIHYETNWRFAWAAFACMLLCIFLVIPSYWGYWQLGRKVTLGPVEIAHAFRSPMTAPPADNPAAVAKTNGTIQELMEEVGDRTVQYGQIVDGEAKGILGVAEPEHVERVHPKIGVAKGEIKELFRTHSTKK